MESLPISLPWVWRLEFSSGGQFPLKENKQYTFINSKKNNGPRKLATNAAVSASFTPFDEEVGVPRGFETDFALVAVDDGSWGFSFEDFGREFAVGFRDEGMLKRDRSGRLKLNLGA